MSQSLADLWKNGREGTLSPLETLKAWALLKVYTDEGYSKQGIYSKIAKKVKKVGGGHPGNDAVRKLLNKIEEDDGRYPGKLYGSAGGRPGVLSEQARLLQLNAAPRR